MCWISKAPKRRSRAGFTYQSLFSGRLRVGEYRPKPPGSSIGTSFASRPTPGHVPPLLQRSRCLSVGNTEMRKIDGSQISNKRSYERWLYTLELDMCLLMVRLVYILKNN